MARSLRCRRRAHRGDDAALLVLLVTIGLGVGITQLDFATGQDSYLDTDEQVYKDNVVYLPLLRDFGRIVAMNVTVALLSALVVLPPMLVWADKRNWVSRGLIDKEPESFIDTPKMGSGQVAEAPPV